MTDKQFLQHKEIKSLKYPIESKMIEWESLSKFFMEAPVVKSNFHDVINYNIGKEGAVAATSLFSNDRSSPMAFYSSSKRYLDRIELKNDYSAGLFQIFDLLNEEGQLYVIDYYMETLKAKLQEFKAKKEQAEKDCIDMENLIDLLK